MLQQRLLVAARWAFKAAMAVILLCVLAFTAGWLAVKRSVPQMDGDVHLAGLSAPATVTRDALGTVVVKTATRLDAARALGFVHAQERFFEMDLTRRSAAGELSALFGAVALPRDEERRQHRLRARLEERLAQLPADERAGLQAYADGVNAGLAGLGARPWQYLLLRADPQPWKPADSLLVVAEMFWTLQASGADAGWQRAMLREKVGDAVYAWLEPAGGRWDAALDGSVSAPSPMPGPDVIDLRKGPPPRAVALAPAERQPFTEPDLVGSNEWAVAGSRTADGRAILADDMHLGLATPGLWFRAQLEFGTGAEAVRASGVTLPGLPALVVGSNGHVAWGFTNAYGQWFDWIRIPEGLPDTRLRTITETIEVKGGQAKQLPVVELDGLPVLKRADGRSYAVRWAGDQGAAYDLGLDALLQAKDLDSALAIAQRAGLPHQNFLVADAKGRIGWTIAGHLWSRADNLAHAGRFEPLDAPAPAWLHPSAYPKVVDPANGQLSTANSRQLGGAGGALIGDGGFDLGARAQQIRDRLAEAPRHDEGTIGAIHLDDEARFQKTWAARISAAIASSPAQDEARRVLAAWNGRAGADQAGYRLVREVRARTIDALWAAWTTKLVGESQADPDKRLEPHRLFEYAVAQALDEKPAHLLPQPFASWDEFLRAQVDATVHEMTNGGTRPLALATWGEADRSHLQHVLSRAVPSLARFLDPPSLPQSGDSNLPHVTAPRFGQSERLVVSPGHEDRATLVLAGGQSGHPQSPYYLAGQSEWAEGKTSPLLAGTPEHTLAMKP